MGFPISQGEPAWFTLVPSPPPVTPHDG
jgi:hypothetical protein